MSDEANQNLPEATPRGSFPRRAWAALRGALGNKWGLFAVVAVVSLVVDQVTKIWARASLPVYPANCSITELQPRDCQGVPVAFLDSFWHWRLSMNPGSAFGMFSSQGGARVFLSIVGILAVIGMLWMLRKSRPDQKVLHWALALVAGGAVGNLIDRMYFGVVTDFILWHLGDFKGHAASGLGRWEHEWPVFNVADIVLVVGVGLMFIDIQKEGKRDKANKQARLAKAKQQGLVKDLTQE
ncbi:MAG TPA: signal peptidase II [Kofleriaceae bacterium]|nr:signal peptidase II [Kofleriaceae bacterium]